MKIADIINSEYRFFKFDSDEDDEIWEVTASRPFSVDIKNYPKDGEMWKFRTIDLFSTKEITQIDENYIESFLRDQKLKQILKK